MRASLVAYGEENIRLAKNVCLPSLGFRDVTVFTDKPKEFLGYDTYKIFPNLNDKLTTVTECHKEALSSGEPTIMLCADMVFGKGTCDFLSKISKSGKKLVVVPAIRLCRDSILPYLPGDFENRELCALSLKHLHPGTKKMFWNSIPFVVSSQIYWGNEDTVVARCMHMHPILMQTSDPINGLTIDAGAINNFTEEDTYVVTDSDELTCFELSPRDYVWYKNPIPKGDEKSFKLFMKARGNHHLHEWFFKHECFIHSGDITWRPVTTLQ